MQTNEWCSILTRTPMTWEAGKGFMGGSFMAVDAANGHALWHFSANQFWTASPMTYMFDDRQYVAVAAGSAIIAFGLPD